MKPKNKLIPKVSSLHDLCNKAQSDSRYAKLLVLSSRNLGFGGKSDDLSSNNLRKAYQNLVDNAMAEPGVTSEKGVVDEVNFCRDLIKT